MNDDMKKDILELKAQLKSNEQRIERLISILIEEGVISRTDIEEGEDS